MKPIEKLNSIADTMVDPFSHGKLIDMVDNLIEIYKIDGRTVIRSKTEDAFLDYILMSDQYFYENWITQFAIGEVAGKNYFDMTTWSQLTEQFTKGVIVVHEETKQFLFLIPKFIEPIYNENNHYLIERLCGLASHAKFQTQIYEQNKTIETFAKCMVEISEKAEKHQGVTSLIPAPIYAFFNINPKVMKAVIYIRDFYKTVQSGTLEIDKLTEILRKHFENEPVTEAEKTFVWGLTENDFVFSEKDDIEKEKRQKEEEKIVAPNAGSVPFNPFSD